MYFIIYKYVLKQGRTMDQVTNWMRNHEATQAKWGAIEADFYRLAPAQTSVFFARYKVKSIDRWTEGLKNPASFNLLRELAALVDFEKTESWIFEEIPY
ncbi:MAG: hypothetical protein U9N73_12090 [Candidatus Auribacterota bacterium]|nr:hypothetical protein [Candidatus Auribacterota bacterium]